MLAQISNLYLIDTSSSLEMEECQDNMIFEKELKEKGWQYQKKVLAWATFWQMCKSL